MLLQVLGQLECFPTLRTSVFLPQQATDLLVQREVAGLGVALGTLGALERLQALVAVHVALELRPVVEALAAERTHEAVLLVVLVDVQLEAVLGLVLPAADVADEALALVFDGDVAAQLGGRPELATARLAVRHRPQVAAEVALQAVLPRKRLVALRALAHLDTVHAVH